MITLFEKPLAIFAGHGNLPSLIHAKSAKPYVIALNDTYKAQKDEVFELEQLGAVFQRLRDRDIKHVIFVGGFARPSGIHPERCDPTAQNLLRQLLPVMGKGDDAALRVIKSFFEESGFTLCAVPNILEDLVLPPRGVIGVPPSQAIIADAQIGDSIIKHLSPLDIGQAVVIEGGLCLGIETLQGTDALLEFVSGTAKHLRQSQGVLVKLPKKGQILEIDMPTVGRKTCENAISAGLSGIAIEAHKTLVLDQEWMQDHLFDLGFSIFTVESDP